MQAGSGPASAAEAARMKAFRTTGGIIIFAIGMDMLRAKGSRGKATEEEVAEAMTKAEVAITPLGIPMIVGPGAIPTVMVLMTDARTPHPRGDPPGRGGRRMTRSTGSARVR